MTFNLPKIRRKRASGEGEPAEAFHLSRTTGLIILLAVLLMISLLSNLYQIKQRPQQQARVVAAEVKQQVLSEQREPADAASEISGHWYGLCPKNSIHTIEDFRRIVKKDPLLTKHFAGFKWEQARLGHHPRAIWTHVTYRKNEKIRTGRKVVKLPAGDGYITDGDRWVRTYCGNDYALANAPQPQPPETERIDTDLNRLIERADTSSQIDDPADPGNDDPLVVPESGTFLLFGAGLGCLGLLSLFKLRKTKARRRKVIRRSSAP